MRLFPHDVIGPPDCPLIHRWTLLGRRHQSWPAKLMLHYFPANADDRDVHDHPWPFLTFVLWGSYDDMKPCDQCKGTGQRHHPITWLCENCDGSGVLLNEHMKAGMLRYRPATHRHRTKVGPKGCLTLVLSGPTCRRWGFWRAGTWWWWSDYESEFGYAMRCEDLDKEYRNA